MPAYTPFPHLSSISLHTLSPPSLYSHSFIRINLRPHLLYPFPLLLGLLPVLRRPLEAQPPQAHVDLVLCVGAVARYFPEEAACVAFVEGCDDFGAGCRWSVSWTGKDGSGGAYSSGLLRCGDGDAL
jgi:hypothetical protein